MARCLSFLSNSHSRWITFQVGRTLLWRWCRKSDVRPVLFFGSAVSATAWFSSQPDRDQLSHRGRIRILRHFMMNGRSPRIPWTCKAMNPLGWVL